MTTEEIIDHIRSLPADEQADLVDRLIVEVSRNGFHESVTEEWTEEIRRRVAMSRAGQMDGTPWEEVRDDIRRRLAEEREQ